MIGHGVSSRSSHSSAAGPDDGLGEVVDPLLDLELVLVELEGELGHRNLVWCAVRWTACYPAVTRLGRQCAGCQPSRGVGGTRQAARAIRSTATVVQLAPNPGGRVLPGFLPVLPPDLARGVGTAS